MKRFFYYSLFYIAITNAGLVHAQDVYVGATMSNTYTSNLNFIDAGKQLSFNSKDRALPLKIFVGHNFSQNLAVELGYKTFGKTTVDPVPGSGSVLSSRSSAWYAAGRGDMQLSEDWSLFGKLGATHTNTTFAGAGELSALSGSVGKLGLYAGVGTAYSITKNLALTLELEHFGIAKEKNLKFNMDGFSAGIRYQF